MIQLHTDLIQVFNVQFIPSSTKRYVAMSFSKESPFLEPFMKWLNKMVQSGVMKKMVEQYDTISDDDSECEERRVFATYLVFRSKYFTNKLFPYFFLLQNALGYHQLIFPFILLGSGLTLSIAFVLVEKCISYLIEMNFHFTE